MNDKANIVKKKKMFTIREFGMKDIWELSFTKDINWPMSLTFL